MDLPGSKWVAPGETAVGLIHLYLLDETPSVWRLLDGVCQGPRRLPLEAASPVRAGCWRHLGRTVCVQQQSLELLPAPGCVAGVPAKVLSSLANSSLCLIEPPLHTPEFEARYARNSRPASEIPPVGFFLDRLQSFWDIAGTRPHAVALVDMGAGIAGQDRERLLSACARVRTFAERRPAITWLLEHAALAAGTGHAPRPAPKLTQEKPTGSLEVRLVDVGGFSALRFVRRLRELRVGEPIRLGWRTILWPGSEPYFLQRRRQAVLFRVTVAPPAPGAHLVIWVGGSRLFGETELSLLMERCWDTGCRPASVVRGPESNPDVLEWFRQEFRGTPEFPAEWPGSARALAHALR